VSDEQAVFLPNLETALGIVHDAGVRIGERVLVVGLGVVGLLASALLLRSGVGELIAWSRRRYGGNRQHSWGAARCRPESRGCGSGLPSSRGAAARMRRST